MKSEELYKLLSEKLLPECMNIMKTKGEAYSGQEDKLGNFKRCGHLAGVTPEKALFIYMMKHIDAISSYMRGEYSDSEPIDGRIKDIINYCFLLYGILEEAGKLNESNKKDS